MFFDISHLFALSFWMWRIQMSCYFVNISSVIFMVKNHIQFPQKQSIDISTSQHVMKNVFPQCNTYPSKQKIKLQSTSALKKYLHSRGHQVVLWFFLGQGLASCFSVPIITLMMHIYPACHLCGCFTTALWTRHDSITATGSSLHYFTSTVVKLHGKGSSYAPSDHSSTRDGGKSFVNIEKHLPVCHLHP